MNRFPSANARDVILEAFSAAIAAVEPAAAFLRYCRARDGHLRVGSREEIDLEDVGKVWLVGAGKASAGLARAAVELLGDRIAGGSIAIRDPDDAPPLGVRFWRAGHPLPNPISVEAADDALRIAAEADTRDLILCLLSGGASSLWAAPPADVSLDDLQALIASLLGSGAVIQEINTVRKHVSRLGGGKLARASRAGRLVTMAISDVVDAPPDVIGSGPTLPDQTTYSDAIAVLRKYRIDPAPSIANHLRRGAERERASLVESEPDARGNTPPSFHILASIDDAIDAAERKLSELGYSVGLMSRTLSGDARVVGREVAERALIEQRHGSTRTAFLWGGETTVNVTGTGRGGRNQELALAAAMHLHKTAGVTVASLATDGSDGPTDAAGGFADGSSVDRMTKAGVDPRSAIDANDSYAALEAAEDLLITGPTGTNVNDLIIALVD